MLIGFLLLFLCRYYMTSPQTTPKKCPIPLRHSGGTITYSVLTLSSSLLSLTAILSFAIYGLLTM